MDHVSRYDRKRLLFRRQFVLGPRFVEEFTWWKRIPVRSDLFLTVHPDLQTHQVAQANKRITLLGYILDPNRPEANNGDILKHLLLKLRTCGNLDDFFKYTYDFGGRWILLVDNGKEMRLFNDATGLRQVFYIKLSSSEIWCASQPGILASVLSLEMDAEAVEFFNAYPKFDNIWSSKEYFWPGDASPYREVLHLLPNHYLNLKTGLCRRYWPSGNLNRMSPKEAVATCGSMLENLMRSASKRFSLALTLTAGLDTRMVLAASRHMKDGIYYFSLVYWNRSKEHPDIKVPSRLLKKLGLKHHVIRCPESMESEFAEIYGTNVTTAHDVYGTIAEGLYHYYPQDRVCVKGNCVEIAKFRSRQPESDDGTITPETLARVTRYPTHTFTLKAFEKWLSDAKCRYNISVWDLFQWEIKHGGWQPMTQLEWDIVQEVFTPFNCRSLLTTLLSVDESDRKIPDFTLYMSMIAELWPEVLSEPINPPYRVPLSLRIKGGAKRAILKKSHLLHWLPRGMKRLGRSLLEKESMG
jgi:hypothetical protein